MEHDPQLPPYKTSDPTSFGSVSAKDRWPVILTSAIDDVHRTVGSLKPSEDTARKEGKEVIEKLATLKYELQHNRALTPLPDDGRSDIATYNEELEQRGYPSWHDVSWLFSECYLYRRIATIFALTSQWRSYDVFARQKLSTFKSSRPAVVELAARYKDLTSQLSSSSSSSQAQPNQTTSEEKTLEEETQAEELLFSEMCQICLWGNATDLSLLTSLTYADIQKLQGSSARKQQENSILVNDIPAAFKRLKDAQRANPTGERRVDILLDNAGFELFVDLVLAGYLLHAGLATCVVLHPKSIPWFVSDVVPADFGALLNALAAPQDFYTALADGEDSDGADGASKGDTPDYARPLDQTDKENLQALFADWSALHADGQLVLRPNAFWTLPGSYWRLPTAAPELFADLRESELVIAKGDLNYRKLTGDVAWPATASFREAVGPLGEVPKGLRVLALRTCKADVVVGLKEEEDDKLKAMDGGGGDSGARKWAWSGKWAVVEFVDGIGG